jgi:hypothetical protein
VWIIICQCRFEERLDGLRSALSGEFECHPSDLAISGLRSL